MEEAVHTAYAQIRNQSPYQNAANVPVQILHNGSPAVDPMGRIQELTVEEIAANTEVSFENITVVNATRENTTSLGVHVDPERQIAELDETNNKIVIPLEKTSVGGCVPLAIPESSGDVSICPYAIIDDTLTGTQCEQYGPFDIERAGSVDIYYNRYSFADSFVVKAVDGQLEPPVLEKECGSDSTLNHANQFVLSDTILVDVCPNCAGTETSRFTIAISCPN